MRAAALNKILPLRKIREVMKLEPRLDGVSAQCVKTTLLEVVQPRPCRTAHLPLMAVYKA